MRPLRSIHLPLLYLWALPTTAIGLAAALIGWLGGARAAVQEGVLEVHGPGIRRILQALPTRFEVLAITLGHVVLACDRDCLDRTRAHERVHVDQCQRWGPAFIPAYLLAGLTAWLRGGDPYWDNPFERQAYATHNQPAQGIANGRSVDHQTG